MTNTLEIWIERESDDLSDEEYLVALPQIRIRATSVVVTDEALDKCTDSCLENDRLTYDLPNKYKWSVEVSGNVAELFYVEA